jgi:hypothetical protein
MTIILTPLAYIIKSGSSVGRSDNFCQDDVFLSKKMEALPCKFIHTSKIMSVDHISI